jgi:arylsulfatase A
MTRRAFMAAGLVAATARPNILMILMDDMASRSLSCYGNPHVRTPHLDRLAAEGMRFTQAYVTPQCTPTRATFLTGQYTARHRMWHVIPWYGYPWARVAEPAYGESLPRTAFTLAKGLRAAGYATACLGKWHLTTGADGDYGTLRPEGAGHYGFDEGMARIPNDVMAADRGVNLLSEQAMGFMERHRARPWFCYLSHHAIHNVLAAPKELVRKYLDKGYPATGLNNATLLASMEHMDAGIGRVLRRLAELGLAERTAVVFMTDNGGIYQQYDPAPVRTADGWRLRQRDVLFESTPLREGKGFAYEGGIRVPLIVRWPGVVKAGGECGQAVHIVDLMPTFFEMAGAKAPARYVMDGRSLVPVLAGGKLPRRALYWYMPLYDIRWAGTPCAVVLDGDYKLIEYFGDSFDAENGAAYRIGNRLELYNLRSDIGEKRDLAGVLPKVVARLRGQLHRWIETCGSPVPGLNPAYDPARALEETKKRQLTPVG